MANEEKIVVLNRQIVAGRPCQGHRWWQRQGLPAARRRQRLRVAIMLSWRASWLVRGFRCSYLRALPSHLPVCCRPKTPSPNRGNLLFMLITDPCGGWLFFFFLTLKCWVWWCSLSVWKCIWEEVHWLMLGNDRESAWLRFTQLPLSGPAISPDFLLKEKKKAREKKKKHSSFLLLFLKWFPLVSSFGAWLLPTQWLLSSRNSCREFSDFYVSLSSFELN